MPSPQAEAADQAPVVEGMDVPAEIARLEAPLQALAEAKRKVEARAQERFQQSQGYRSIRAGCHTHWTG